MPKDIQRITAGRGGYVIVGIRRRREILERMLKTTVAQRKDFIKNLFLPTPSGGVVIISFAIDSLRNFFYKKVSHNTISKLA